MLTALENILRMNSTEFQIAALHGLGHLEHKGKESLIQTYLKKHPHLDDEIRDYAMACITGDVM